MFFRNKSSLVLTILLLVGFGAILTTALAPRDFSLGSLGSPNPEVGRGVADTVSRGLVAGILFLCGIAILRSGVGRKFHKREEFQLWFFYLLFFFTTVVCSALFGKVPGFRTQMLYAPLVFFTMYRAPGIPKEDLTAVTKVVLFAFMYGSILAMFIAPDFAKYRNYKSYLPGIDFRLYGVAPHANSLGPIAISALGMEIIAPSRNVIRITNLVTACTVLILAQSKTVWACAVLIGLYFFILKVNQLLRRRKTIHVKWRGFSFYVFFVMVAVAFAASFIDLSQYERGKEILSLTGRTTIWNITMEIWKENPWFGYGVNLWNLSFRSHYSLAAAGQAHNQFVHILGMSGMVGFTGFVIYIGALYRATMKVAAKTPVPFLFLIVILMSCMTEAPLNNFHILTTAFSLHVLLFAHLIQAFRSEDVGRDGLTKKVSV